MALRQPASPVSKALPIASPSHRTTSTILATGACPSRSPGAEVRRGICLDQSCCATRPRKRRKKRPAGTKPCLLRKKQNLDQQPSRVEDRKSTRLNSSHSCASRMPPSDCTTKNNTIQPTQSERHSHTT